MNMRNKHIRRLIAATLCLLLPLSIAAADGAPTVSLYGPSVNASSAAGQKLVLALSEAMQPVAGKSIVVTAGSDSFSADAAACTLQSSAGLYAVYDFSAFDGLALAPSSTYDVSAEAGAFRNAGGTDSAAMTASFTTAADASLLPVVYTLGGDGWSVKVKDGASLRCGEGVAGGTVLTFTPVAPSGYTATFSVKSAGADVAAPTLDQYTVVAATEAYATITEAAALTGDVQISGTPAVGSPLTASLVNSNESDASRLTFTWKRGETTLADGVSYTPVAADLGATVTVTVVSTAFTGERTGTSDAVTKADYAGDAPDAPVRASATETSLSLAATDGYEYRMDGGAWQSDPTFTGLAANASHTFTQRVKETDVSLASPESAQLITKTVGPLTGTANVSGLLQVGQAVSAVLNNTNNSGSLSYVWKRDANIIASTESYTLTEQDAEKQLTIEITSDFETGVRSFTTAAVRKTAYPGPSPAAPTLMAAAATSVTLDAIAGYEYSCGGTAWQNSPTFTGLSAGQTYYFYQRVAGSASSEPSVASPALSVTTAGASTALTGTLTVSGAARYGQTLVASVTNTNNTGTLSYVWKVNGAVAGTSAAYEIKASDLYRQIIVEVTSSVQGGVLSKAVGTVQKSDYLGQIPPAPTRKSRTTSSITLNAVEGCEYSRDGSNWQADTKFSGLASGRTYTFYQRYMATATSDASPASDPLKTSTTASSDSSTTTKTPTPTPKGVTPTPKPGSTAMPLPSAGQDGAYIYTPAEDSTRILYSTMQNLVAVNKAQDVVIRLKNASYTFAKGTMQLGAEQAWYDFGVEINDCIHVEAGKRLAGDGYAATVHFNYSGALPAEAEIRLLIGVPYAAKTLRYEKLDSVASTLNYVCDAPVDAAGYASVRQSSCSDYVLRDPNAAAPSPTLDPSASPSASPLINEPPVGEAGNGMGVTGWIITLMIVAALVLVAVGVYLYYKNRDY